MRSFNELRNDEMAYSLYLVFYKLPFLSKQEKKYYDKSHRLELRTKESLVGLQDDNNAKKFWLYGINQNDWTLHKVSFKQDIDADELPEKPPSRILIFYTDGADNITRKLETAERIPLHNINPANVLAAYHVPEVPVNENIERISPEGIENLLR